MKKPLTKPQIIERLMAANVQIPTGNQTVATLTELAAANNVNIEPEDVPGEEASPEGESGADDISWRVAAGLTYPQAVEASNRQKAEDEANANK